MRTFEASFVTEYQTAFNELIRLGQVAAEKNINGKESKKEDEIAQRLLICLKALSSPGLSDAQIEALEYCLRQLNDSLVVPTISPIVELDPVYDAVVYRMPMWAGLFRANMQEFIMAKTSPYSMSIDNASFALTLQNAGFVRAQNMSIGNGSFALSLKNINLSHEVYVPPLAPYDLELDYAEAVGGTPTWRALFDGVVLEVTGNGDTDANTLAYSSSTIVCAVYKVSNSGVTEDAGNVTFLRNGAADAPSTSFLVGENYDGSSGPTTISHTFIGLSVGDTVSVDITEG